MLRLITLEPRDAPVFAEVVSLSGREGDWLDVANLVRTAAARFEWADGVLPPVPTRPLPTLWGTFDGLPAEPLLPDRVRIIVGPVPAYYPPSLGLGAPSNFPGERPQGGSVAIDLAAVRAGGFDLETLVLHEVGHALGLQHTDDPASVMYPYLPPGVRRQFTPADAQEAWRAGWRVAVPLAPEPREVVVRFSYAGGIHGYEVCSPERADQWRAAVAHTDPTPLPPYARRLVLESVTVETTP